MKKILVTGGTGFIGAHLVKKLNALGHSLKLLVRETSDITQFKNFTDIEYIFGDVQKIDSIKEEIKETDLIFHLAAYTGIWAKDKSIYYDTNVLGTENISKIALDNNMRFYYMSSFTAIGPTPPKPVDELYEKEHFSMEYERSKYLAKRKVRELIKKGLKGTIFYPGIVYGPGDFNIFGEMLYDITRGKFLGCPGKGESLACFTFIDDLVDGIIKTIDNDETIGEEFILGGENVKFGDYLDLIAEIAGKKKPRRFPMSAAILYGLYYEIKAKLTKKKPYITRPTLQAIKYHRAYSSDKAIEELGYEITPLRQGLEQTISWYKNYIKNHQGK